MRYDPTPLTKAEIIDAWEAFNPDEWTTRDGVTFYETCDLRHCPNCEGPIHPADATVEVSHPKSFNWDICHEDCAAEWADQLTWPSDFHEHAVRG